MDITQHDAKVPTMNAPPLVALIYREGKRPCRQYAFATCDEIAVWAGRFPYRTERLRVMPVVNGKLVSECSMPAAEAADFVRKARHQTTHQPINLSAEAACTSR